MKAVFDVCWKKGSKLLDPNSGVFTCAPVFETISNCPCDSRVMVTVKSDLVIVKVVRAPIRVAGGLKVAACSSKSKTKREAHTWEENINNRMIDNAYFFMVTPHFSSLFVNLI
jgi:hypothetical protein